ncbi:MAG: hypothetical protein AUG51_06490 [Acidobacteria bacterium 13_1_20CM_3_53_8]|nr:MAG: hypothetical protein AUG51_06490 [Acidobacteria bacterium 13_1_20CM_3_53_8]
MRQRFAVILTIALVLGLLIVLNAASYMQQERARDSEYAPDRSTYNSGATGTRALFDYLGETGNKVVRWRESTASLLSGRTRPQTFVVIGETQVPFERTDAENLLKWVNAGGRLVLIDRRPDVHLLPASDNWRVTTALVNYPAPDVQTRDVESVSPSRFAALIKVFESGEADQGGEGQKQGANPANEDTTTDDEEPRPPRRGQSPIIVEEPPRGVGPSGGVEEAQPPILPENVLSPAPVVQLADSRGALMIDYPHGRGRIILLSDPFIVANGGISQADNLQLAVNAIVGAGGLIAFDEYHQGRGATQNYVIAYFKGTPVIAMVGQLALIVLAVLWTSGRRFGRALPLPVVDRRSSLEYVASMAELQERARAYDLAVENVYTRTRRVLMRYAGVEYNTTRSEIAARVAERSGIDRQRIETLMHDCEDAINGAPIDARRAVDLVARLRRLERRLGLRMRQRELKQAKEA